MFIESKGWERIIEKNLFDKQKKKLNKIKKEISKTNKDFAFLKNEKNNQIFEVIKKAKLKFKKLDEILLIGTGGSSLGTKALLKVTNNKKISFLSNLDPNTIKLYLNKNKKKNIGLLIISKSGETLEVLSLFDIIINSFKKQVDLKNHTLIITDNRKSSLRLVAEKYNIQVIDHDEEIGGRFSCFSITSLLPLYVAGVDSVNIKKLADSYFKKILGDCLNFNNSVSALSCISKKKKYIGHVFLVYIDSFNNISEWYRQLWSESLGKNKAGMHLITAKGAVDQHSQLQMWLDGPKNLIFTVVVPNARMLDIKIKDIKNALPNYLKSKNIGEILNIMAKSTITELQKFGIPVRVIYLDDDQTKSAVDLMTMLLLEVTLLGKLIGINPFDQPAVENVKIRVKKTLNKYE